MAATGADRQKYLTDLRRKAVVLLNQAEVNYLFNAIKEYSLHRSVEKLAECLLNCLNTSQKLVLLRDVRHLILKAHLPLYDRLLPHSSVINPLHTSNVNHAEPLRLMIPRNDAKYGSDRTYSDNGKPFGGTSKTRTKVTQNDHLNEKLLQAIPKSSQKEPENVDNMKLNGISNTAEHKSNTFRVVSFTKDRHFDKNLGFTIKGGKEHNWGIFVGSVKPGSPADNRGLKENDQIIEVNGISFDHIAISSAANLLASLNKLKLVVKSVFTPIAFRETVAIDPWGHPIPLEHSFESGPENGHDSTDPINQNKIQMSGSDSSSVHDEEAQRERKVRIIVDLSSTKDLGFNIRGGSEYGLGIYVSSVDNGSLAEASGLKVADQILSANGLSFEKIRHNEAVNFLKSNRDIIFLVKSVGKVPEARCVFSEFSWLTPDGTRILDSNRNKYLSSSMPAESFKEHRDVAVDPIDTAWNNTLGDFRLSKESVGIQTPDLIVPVDTLDIKSRNRNSDDLEIDGSPVQSYKKTQHKDHNKKLEKSDNIQTPLEPRIGEPILKAFSVSDSQTDAHKGAIVTLESAAVPNLNDLEGKGSNQVWRVEVDHNDVDGFGNAIKNTPGSSQLIQGKEMNRSGSFLQPRVSEDKFLDAPSKKGSRSKSFLQKQSEKLKEKFSLRKKNKSVDRDLLNSHLFERQRSSQEVLLEIREKAKLKLGEDDFDILIKCIKHYLEKGDIEVFSTQIIGILDTPAKAELLKVIREIVFPYDTSRFDVRIARREIEYLEELGNGAEPKLFEGAITDKPPRRTIVKAVQAKGGKFQLKSKEEAEQIEKEKELKSKTSSKIYFQTKSILERDRTIQKYDSFHDIPQPSSEFAAPLEQLKNVPPSSSGLSSTEIEAMYAKVDKREKEKCRSKAANNKNDHTQLTHDSHRKISEENFTPLERDVEQYNHPESILVNNDNGDTLDNDMDDFDDDYAIPFVNAPLPAKAIHNTRKALERRTLLVNIPKTHPSLGISISGGKGSTAQPDVLIERVFPTGAAHQIKELKAGQQLVSIDGQSLEEVSHSEAVDIIRRAYNDKAKTKMEMEVFID